MLAALVGERSSLAADAVPQLDESERARRVEYLQLAQVDLDRLAAWLYGAKLIEGAANFPQRRERPIPRYDDTNAAAFQRGPAGGVKDFVKRCSSATSAFGCFKEATTSDGRDQGKNARKPASPASPAMKQCRLRGTRKTLSASVWQRFPANLS